MQIGQIKTFNRGQRNKLWVYARLERFRGLKGLRMRVCWGFVGLITIDGLSNVGPKTLLDHREKEVADCLNRFVFTRL